MKNRIRLEEMPIHKDGIRSSQSTDNIDGFTASNFYSKFQNTNDFSALNTDLFSADDSYQSQLNFSPLRCNFLRAFDWKSGSDVLEISSAAGAITYFLAEHNQRVDAIEPNRQLAQLTQLRTRQFSEVSVISESFQDVDFGNKKYDAIILNGATDMAKRLSNKGSQSYRIALNDLLTTCRDLLKPEGRIFLAADNRQGLKYIYGATDERILKSYHGFRGYTEHDNRQTLNLTEWRSLVTELSFEQIDEYYLFPEFRFASVLLGKEYCQLNQDAFQHLEGIRSKDYFQYQTPVVNEILLYQAANAHGHLGDVANSCLFVLGKNKSNDQQKLDFAHFPSFERKPKFISLVKKNNGEDFIRRTRLFEKVSKNDQELITEPYTAGRQLSVIWRNSIISDIRGIEFEQCLLSYLDYLKKLDSGVLQGMNIDAIPNNIIVDGDSQWQLIDREWLSFDQEIDVKYIFYRAIVHFALRNASIFYHFNWTKEILTLGDFVFYCFQVVGLNQTAVELEKMRNNDLGFLSHVMVLSTGYQLTDEFGGIFAMKVIYPCLHWCYESRDYRPEQKCVYKTKADDKSHKLIFCIPKTQQSVKGFRFHPFMHQQSNEAGYFGIDSLQIKAVDEMGGQRIILNLESSDRLHQANIHDAAFYSKKNSEHVFIFNTHDTFLEFEMPEYKLNENERLQIEIDFRLAPSHDYEIARQKFGLVERKLEESLRLKDEQLKLLDKKFIKQTQELKEIQKSKVWRCLEAFRDNFRLTGYPEKNPVTKLINMVKSLVKPKSDRS